MEGFTNVEYVDLSVNTTTPLVVRRYRWHGFRGRPASSGFARCAEEYSWRSEACMPGAMSCSATSASALSAT